MSSIYWSVTGITSSQILNITVNSSHSSTTAVAVIECLSHSLSLNDPVEIDIGYPSDHGRVFTGYVKSIEYKSPERLYTITCNDVLIRALDYFIVSTNPTTPLSFSNISAEDLIQNLLETAGLTSFDMGTSYFTFGVSNPFEINQVSAYDYCRSISDLLTWHIWADEYGTVHFKNRKPFLMTGSEPQPGWVNDSPISYTWLGTKTLTAEDHYDEKDLRNRIVVYGANDIYAEAKDESTPYFKWKTAVLVATDLIDSQSVADDTAAYNLHLYKNLTNLFNTTVLGDHLLLPYRAVTVNLTGFYSSQNFYIYSAEHRISKEGYITGLQLKRQVSS